MIIAITVPDWPLFIRLSKELGLNLTAPLDEAGMKPQGLDAYISMLGFLKNKLSPYQSAKETSIFSFIHVTMLIKLRTDEAFHLFMDKNFNILKEEGNQNYLQTIVISGSLNNYIDFLNRTNDQMQEYIYKELSRVGLKEYLPIKRQLT